MLVNQEPASSHLCLLTYIDVRVGSKDDMCQLEETFLCGGWIPLSTSDSAEPPANKILRNVLPTTTSTKIPLRWAREKEKRIHSLTVVQNGAQPKPTHSPHPQSCTKEREKSNQKARELVLLHM